MRRIRLARPVLYLAVLPLAACSRSQAPPAVAEGEDVISCALAGSTQMKPVCGVERHLEGPQLTLVVHHPDGGFRRFDVQSDGSGLKASDGADVVRTRLENGQLEVHLGNDRYLFPVTVKPEPTNHAKS